jgi:hypothetical protein
MGQPPKVDKNRRVLVDFGGCFPLHFLRLFSYNGEVPPYWKKEEEKWQNYRWLLLTTTKEFCSY